MQLTLLIVLCCMFPFLMTVLGSAAVFLCPHGMRQTARKLFLGFAAGVMLAASVWSLLNPAIAAAETIGIPGWIPASVGVACGVLFLLGADCTVSAVRARANVHTQTCRRNGKPSSGSSFLLQLAMTVHNIPEGMAVGLSTALAAEAILMTFPAEIPSFGCILVQCADHPQISAELSAALALSLGIGIQNFPEGAAVSLPLRQDGMSCIRAFLRGCLSGIVEPIFGIATAFFLSETSMVMPWLLSFAAGAMLYVVAEELIPASHCGQTSDDPENGTAEHGGVSYIGTLSTVAGFLVMMILDVALG